jgi:hypothetical protein
MVVGYRSVFRYVGYLGRRLFELKGGRNVGENAGERSSLPLFSARPGKEENMGVFQNGTVSSFSLSFFFNSA